MANNVKAEVEEAISLPDSLLFGHLGQELNNSLGNNLTITPAPTALIALGVQWLLENRNWLCKEKSVKKLVLNSTDNVEIVLALVQLLASYKLHFNPVPLAVLLARKGIKKYCSGEWRPEAEFRIVVPE